jgi:hypothetical protein
MKKLRIFLYRIVTVVILLSVLTNCLPMVKDGSPNSGTQPVVPTNIAQPSRTAQATSKTQPTRITQPTRTDQPALAVAEISDNRADYPGSQIPRYEKLEITFQVRNSVAGNYQLPYDPDPPAGIDSSNPKHSGITVDALFLPSGETDWGKAIRQPAFYYQYFDDQVKMSWDGYDHEWHYPTGSFAWKARFAPHLTGKWQYRLAAQDASGSITSPPLSFSVTSSDNPGFLKVSRADPRYFEFDSGAPFHASGFQGAGAFDNPTLANEPHYRTYAQNGINLIRIWISGMYGTSWLEWLGGRNQYDGYLPRAGTEAFQDPLRAQDSLTMVMDYETGGDTGWYDACRFQFWNDPEAVKPDTDYRLEITYWGEDIRGPRDASHSDYGLVGKIGGNWEVDCYQSGTSNVVTGYGGSTADWGTLQGTWQSGSNNFLPRIYLGLENVVQGKAYIRSISLREELGDGQLGPEIINEPSMEYELYFPEQSAYALDKIVRLAEDYGVYLKLVIMEKNDMIYSKLDDDGSFVLNGEEDNQDGFYGLGRGVNKTRWLQQAWWRYLQARWGYSTAIHSWEATNEGDPWLESHYQLADELGKFFHCEVFDVSVAEGDGQACIYNHPNSHMVSTSFWHSFPAEQFWKNDSYPNVDYADLHAYISTSAVDIPNAELEKMQWDAAYYHTGHSQTTGGWDIGKPVVRGEAGIDAVGLQVEQPDLALDQNGVWLHNYLWSTVDSGALVELYWWGDNREMQPGPDGMPGLHEIYRYFQEFMGDIPLNIGSYQAVVAAASDSKLRLSGQIDPQNNRAHLWVQNKNHTWKNVVDGAGGTSGLPGTVTINGFSPNTTLAIEWHTFTSQGIPAITKTTVTSNGSGDLLLNLPSDPAITDVGIKIGDYSP